MAFTVEHLLRTAATLEQALLALEATAAKDGVLYDLYRNAAIKTFELSLETAGKLILRAFDGIMSRLDDRISAGYAHISCLTELRDTLLPRLISGQLRLPDDGALLKEAA